MSRIYVTRKENVQLDSDGAWLIDSNGEVVLHNPDEIGHLVKTHALQTQILDPEKQMIVAGFIFRAEVYWEHDRCPSPAMEDPATIVWLNFQDEGSDDEPEDGEDEGEYEEDFQEARHVSVV
jgi:hypothetical protein